MVEGFLGRRRDSIALAIVLVDARHRAVRARSGDAHIGWWTATSRASSSASRPTSCPATSGPRRIARCAAAFATAPDGVAPFLVSAKDGLGIKELWRHVDAALAAHRMSPAS